MYRHAVVTLYLVAVLATARAQSSESIDGEINEAKAMRLLFGNYDPKQRASTLPEKTFAEVYATQSATIDETRLWFLYTTSNTPDNKCHACQVTLGAAAFEQQGSRWVKKVDNRKLDSIGHDGYAQDSKPVQWGTKSFGLLVDNSWTGYGQLSSWQSLYGYESGTFRLIFTIPLSDTNGFSLLPDNEKYAWDAAWRFGPPSANGVFDIAVTLKMGSIPKAKGQRERIPVAGTYRYDGKTYKHRQTSVPLGGK